MDKIKQIILKTIKTHWLIIILFFLYLVIFTQVKVKSGSMEPTIMTGDICLLYDVWPFYKPQRGDVVGFTMENEIWMKRVIGLPGDRIEIIQGLVLVNGELLEENYLPEGTYTDQGAYDIYTVPDDCVFLLGDNRDNSFDARYWYDHYIPLNRIIGKYGITVWHAQR